MMDIFTNTTPHGLLREIDPEAAAALEAWPHGAEGYGGNGWARRNPLFLSHLAYRAIPAPKREVRWHNVYGCGTIGEGHMSRAMADEFKSRKRIAVLRIDRDEDGSNVTVDVEPV